MSRSYNTRQTQRTDIQRRLANLRLAQQSIDNEVQVLERTLRNLTLDHENTRATAHPPEPVEVPPPATYQNPQDSSFQRVRGQSATPSLTVPINFNRRPPYRVGDIVEITNNRNGQRGRQGVVDRSSSSFVYFSNDNASYHRAPQNLKRIHISEYDPIY